MLFYTQAETIKHLQDANDKHVATIRELRATLKSERDMLDALLSEAAGECVVALPKPGTDLAKVLVANRELKRKRDDLQAQAKNDREQIAELEKEVKDLRDQRGIALHAGADQAARVAELDVKLADAIHRATEAEHRAAALKSAFDKMLAEPSDAQKKAEADVKRLQDVVNQYGAENDTLRALMEQDRKYIAALELITREAKVSGAKLKPVREAMQELHGTENEDNADEGTTPTT